MHVWAVLVKNVWLMSTLKQTSKFKLKLRVLYSGKFFRKADTQGIEAGGILFLGFK